MCICIWGLNQWFQNIAEEGYLNAKVFPCQAAQLWVNIEGTHLNSRSDVLKVHFGEAEEVGEQICKPAARPCKLRPRGSDMLKGTPTQPHSSWAWSAVRHTSLMVYTSLLLALNLFVVLSSSLMVQQIIHFYWLLTYLQCSPHLS